MRRPPKTYPAPRGRMHRAFKGLYGNRVIQFGNKVSFAENKSRRTWKPNVQVKSMYSEGLQRVLRFRITTYAMRCVKKAGGIDEYLMKTKDSELKYDKAIEMKRELREIARVAKAQAKAGLGGGALKATLVASFGSAGLGDSVRETERLPGLTLATGR